MKTNTPLDSKQLRRKYLQTFHNDGLLDFFVGWSVVSAGIFLATGATIFSFLGWMPILLIAPIKNRYIVPRFGYVRFSKPVQIPLPILVAAGGLLVLGSLLAYFLGGSQSGFQAPLAVGILGLGLLVALGTGFNRLALYALFIPAFFIIGLGLNLLTPGLVILLGALLMVLGIYLFITFLKKYPLVDTEGTDD